MVLNDTPPDSVCILRLSALGDVTHVVPVVRAFQRAWPATRLCWIIGTLERRLLGEFSGVEFIVFDKRGGWRAVRDLRERLRARRFDVLLQMQVSSRASLLGRLVRSPVRIGWDRQRSREFHHWFTNRRIAPVSFQHQVEAFLEFPRALGIVPGQPVWNLPVHKDALAWADERVESGRPAIVISPCSSHPLRDWRPECYAAVAEHAVDRYGAQIILCGGRTDAERRMGRAIERAMRHPCLNLVGADTLEQFKAVLARAQLLIAPDSGPVHIASALGTPVLGLYAATWSKRSGPYRSLDLCVDRFPEAARRFCGTAPEALRWGTRIEVPGVMDLIKPDDAIERLQAWHETRVLPFA